MRKCSRYLNLQTRGDLESRLLSSDVHIFSLLNFYSLFEPKLTIDIQIFKKILLYFTVNCWYLMITVPSVTVRVKAESPSLPRHKQPSPPEATTHLISVAII